MQALKHHEMVGCMGRVGAAGDNAAMESFFVLLQNSVLDRRRWDTREQLRIAIVTWIERTYQRRRRQSGRNCHLVVQRTLGLPTVYRCIIHCAVKVLLWFAGDERMDIRGLSVSNERRALITGITGQDGGHLARLLNDKGYEVFGLLRGQRNARRESLEEEFPFINIIEGDLTDQTSLIEAVLASQPTEIYNLGAISHVGYSFRNPQLTAEITAKGVLNLLEATRVTGFYKTSRFYQASTSEMFGGLDYNRPGNGYNESSLFHPRSPYGVAKLYAHWIARNYRESYGMFISTGILFNHEGERRGLEFVTRKITNAVAKIYYGRQDYLALGDIWPKRDWGYAGDYVRGMWQMLQHDEPDDFVLATGETHSIEEFITLAFSEVGISDWTPYVKHDSAFVRPAEVDVLLGDPTKAERVLGWRREVDFPGLVRLMVQHDLRLEAGKGAV